MTDEPRVSVVYLDEGDEEGGIAHPTQDLIAKLEDHTNVREVTITQNRSFDPRYWFRLGRRASKDADIVHIQFEYGSFGDLGGMFLGSMFPVFARGVDVPIVATLHNFRDRQVDVSITDPGSVLSFLSEHATWFVDRSLVSNADFFIPLMNAEVNLLQQHGVLDDKIEHIPLVSETNPKFRDSYECKRELCLQGRTIVTAFGWVRRSKGYDRVIEIIDDLPEDAIFLIAGGTRSDSQEEYLNELEALVAERGLEDRVRFTGYVGRSEHSKIMNATDVMVFPYRDNRASDALARALAYHLPIVASDNEEFLAVEENWGCVRTVSNNRELAEAITLILEDQSERERLQSQAKNYTAEMNWGTVADRIAAIYNDILDA